ncbi:acyl-CoA dehydrogenase family protein [Pseudonocardia kunmingensis]|uniref:Acyl-CoA dehydrogenase n=1 Tax=Pseudonocardia kunmingensis TaxID=630975 RepID=A0A543DP04_9PSEU|nr:acyl-CoA dehydrogenase family protein [Pseudonocardia kunmingensis]TQM11066.1 acyl-CoA dehydrogenase [Pseudonocardia kunmingensis]
MMDPTAYEDFRAAIFASMWRDLAPLEEEIEEHESIPREKIWPALREMGAFGLLIPTEYGGHGLSIAQYLPIIAEFAKVHGGIRALVHVHNSMGHAFWELADERQRDAVLPGVADGARSVAFGLTEPDSGTGLDTATTAVADGDDYVINGRKWLITNSDFASHFMVFARTGSTLSVVTVERDAPGLRIEELPETMGCKGGQHGLLTFTDVRVPQTNRLGAEGSGAEGMERALEISRVLVAASSLGTAEYALDLSVRFAQQRVTFGKPIASRQAVQRYLAEMATDVHALRLLLDDAAAKWDAGRRIPQEASICKLFGLEAVGRVTDRALLVHGGIGYTRRHPIERLYRDARLNWLEEGTPTIQQLVIARELLKGAARHSEDMELTNP